MDPIRTRTAVWVGAIGGVATILGVALPWLIDNTQQPGVSINGLLTGPYVLIFGVVMVAASVFFLTDTDPRKVVAILAPASLAALAYVLPIAIDKEAGLFGGISEGSSTERGIGLYVTIVGGVLGLVATAIVVKGADGARVDGLRSAARLRSRRGLGPAGLMGTIGTAPGDIPVQRSDP